MRNPSSDDWAFVVELGRRIRLSRRCQGLTQEEVGDRAGLSRSCVAVFEAGRGGIDVVTLRRIAAALGLSLPELVDVPASGREEAR